MFYQFIIPLIEFDPFVFQFLHFTIPSFLNFFTLRLLRSLISSSLNLFIPQFLHFSIPLLLNFSTPIPSFFSPFVPQFLHPQCLNSSKYSTQITPNSPTSTLQSRFPRELLPHRHLFITQFSFLPSSSTLESCFPTLPLNPLHPTILLPKTSKVSTATVPTISRLARSRMTYLHAVSMKCTKEGRRFR